MMIRFVLILFFFVTTNCFSKIPTDSIRINRLEAVYQRRTDSLQRELQFYKVKEDYFASAVDRQASHFEFLLSCLIAIIGIGLAIAGFVSYKSFNNKIELIRNEWRKDIIKQEDINKDFILRTNSIKSDIYFQLGVVVSKIGFSSQKAVAPEESLNTYLTSLKNYLEAYQIGSSDDRKKYLIPIPKAVDNCVLLSNNLLKKLESVPVAEKVNKFEKINTLIVSLRKRYTQQLLIMVDMDFYDKALELMNLLKKIEAVTKINK